MTGLLNRRADDRDVPITRGANGCPTPSKQGYDTRSDAKQVMRKMSGRGNVHGKLVAYLCGCGFFHLGNQPKSVTREDMRARRRAVSG